MRKKTAACAAVSGGFERFPKFSRMPAHRVVRFPTVCAALLLSPGLSGAPALACAARRSYLPQPVRFHRGSTPRHGSLLWSAFCCDNPMQRVRGGLGLPFAAENTFATR